jgi:uncharacterized repeat protein (TIGR01451 family)
MSNWSRMIARLVPVIGLLGMASTANAQSTASSGPSVQTSTDTADVQQPFLVTGTGFAPSQTLALTIADNNEKLDTWGTAATDASGAFTAAVRIPADVPYGMQPITATDPKGDNAQGQVMVKWGGWPPLQLTVKAASGPSAGQVTYTVSGYNLSDYILQTVRVRLPIPTGATFVSATRGGTVFNGAEVAWDNAGPLPRGPLLPRSATFQVAAPAATHAWAYFYHVGSGQANDSPPGFQSTSVTADVSVTPH